MRAQRAWQILAVMACAALLAAPAIAGDDGQGGGERSGVCVLDGAWVGFHENPYLYGLIRWTVVHDPDSHWKGTMQLHFVGADGASAVSSRPSHRCPPRLGAGFGPGKGPSTTR